jgi:hypothetical protein
MWRPEFEDTIAGCTCCHPTRQSDKVQSLLHRQLTIPGKNSRFRMRNSDWVFSKTSAGDGYCGENLDFPGYANPTRCRDLADSAGSTGTFLRVKMVQGAIAGIVAFTQVDRVALQGLTNLVCIRWCQRGKTQANTRNHSLAGRKQRN